MQRSSSSYTYPPYGVSTSPPKQYPAAHSTSSAFSASANPNEDWTKISDLAERRRIQNRIAQRNYRKKLKKRLEDLERRAGSDSGSPEHKDDEIDSPEQQYASIAQPVQSPTSTSSQSSHSRRRSSAMKSERSRTPDVLGQQYVLPAADRGMFSEQYTRQMSTSPPPLSYTTFPASANSGYAMYPQSTTYCGQPAANIDMSLYPRYLSTPSYLPGTVIKQEYYGDDDLSPFAMSYASMAGVDVSTPNTYQDISAYVSHDPRRQSQMRNYGVPPSFSGRSG